MFTDKSTDRIFSGVLILFTAALVLWIRLLPLQLPFAGDLAEKILRQRLQNNIELTVRNKFPQSEWEQQTELQLEDWIKNHSAQWRDEKEKLTNQIKSELRYQDTAGNEHTYLGDRDSYFWLRSARNYLATGTACDASINGECRDNYGLAPVGLAMLYSHSVHIAAIAGLHRLITFFNPDYPLPASAFLVPVVVSIIGLIPAFFIGRRLAGNLGGFCAAVQVSCYPVFLERSLGGDNDVWNIVLPLLAVWAVIIALDAKKTWGQIVYSLLAGGIIGLQAGAWRGWVFFFIVLLCGLLTVFVVCGVQQTVRSGSIRAVYRSPAIGHISLVLVLFIMASALFTTLNSSDSPASTQDYMFFKNTVIKSLFNASRAETAPAETRIFPDAFQTVSELKHTDILTTVNDKIALLLGLSGMLALTFLTDNKRWYKLIIWLTGTLSVYMYILINDAPNRIVVISLLSLFVAVSLLLQIMNNSASREDLYDKSGLIIVVWFLAAFYLVFQGHRFLLLWGPPLGLCIAVAVGRMHRLVSEKLSAVIVKLIQRPSRASQADSHHGFNTIRFCHHAVKVVSFCLFSLILIPVVKAGYQVSYNYTPLIQDPWWNILTDVHNLSARDAIVSAGWENGYWVKYVADRRTTVDGGSLSTHAPYWMGKLLSASTEAETVNIMRMLNCGSDATPLPEGRFGAFGKIKASGYSDIETYLILINTINKNKTEALDYLHRLGFTDQNTADIVNSTHCDPPDSYLIVSTAELSAFLAWLHFGLWDPHRAYIADQMRGENQGDDPGSLITDRLRWLSGYTMDEYLDLYKAATDAVNAQQRTEFMAPGSGTVIPKWKSCRTVSKQTMTCQWDSGSSIQIDLTALAEMTLPGNLRFINKDSDIQEQEIRPGLVVLADRRGMRQINHSQPAHSDIAVLIDPIQQQLLVGSPGLIKSTYVQLAILDGRYLRHLNKVAEQKSAAGYRVSAWRVSWD